MTGFKVVPKIELYTDFDEFVRMIGLSDRDLILTDRCFVNMLSSRALPCRILAQDDFGPGEPSCSKITAILAEAQKSEYNRVIAIGGGTAIDISKILALDSVTDLTDLFTGKIPVRRTRKLVIVPTTCGTGSEVTNISIVAFEQLGTKMGLANDALYADIAALVPEFLKTLPYALTGAQKRALDDCLCDLKKKTPMSRIVQGDVGSGKTVVAAAVMYYVAKCGRQSCLMAPTEILAVQHYASFQKLFDGLNINCALLTGSSSAADRRQILAGLSSGEIDVLIGTHAVFQKDVGFKDLALAVTDEQHRFGVAQRSRLSEKGRGTHILVMSATPIPRTLAMILYGDMDISVIDELPPGRQKISTHLVDGSYHDRMYSYLRDECLKGAQAYVVCPLVEENDYEELRSAVEYADRLCREHLKGISVQYLHGKMKGKEKERILRDFADGKTQVIVSTTVVEVGVDVPNATIMIIENSDRFGLLQLHQLRGRVGRGKKKSYCFVVSDTKNEKTSERLNAFCSTSDGFEISRKDLELRGPGDFFGQRQSGLPIFRHADLLSDMQTLEQARSAAEEIVNDPLWFTDETLVGLKDSVIELFDRVDFNIFS